MAAGTLKATCLVPWYELNIMYNRRVGCCCYYNGYVLSWDNSRARDVFDYWNGSLISKIRADIVSGSADSGCADCGFYRFKEDGAAYASFAPPPDATSEQKDNLECARKRFEQGAITVDHTPVRFYFNFGVGCNLDCIMCGQTADRPDDTSLNADILWAWKPHFKKALTLSLIGGEPLVLPQSLSFIRRVVDDEDLVAVTLDIYSNGATLDKQLDLLSRKNKVSICVSLDGVGSTYEAIRRGGNWDKVERNLLAFKELAARRGLKWGLTTANLIMRTSLAGLERLIDWHIAHDIVPNFSDFSLAPGIEKTFLAENIFEFPHLLAEVPDWQRQFDVSAQKSESKGWWEVASILRNMKLDLVQKLFRPIP
ncbi:hypothetical protein MTBLM1_80185 [Rhodospirillaceae bacterium LM-1]|nr:hypothetical protein MTBLM1_80185 [Rhodospirillaceae bacterium LM-1]